MSCIDSQETETSYQNIHKNGSVYKPLSDNINTDLDNLKVSELR